jgi:hypothetical protein
MTADGFCGVLYGTLTHVHLFLLRVMYVLSSLCLISQDSLCFICRVIILLVRTYITETLVYRDFKRNSSISFPSSRLARTSVTILPHRNVSRIERKLHKTVTLNKRNFCEPRLEMTPTAPLPETRIIVKISLSYTIHFQPTESKRPSCRLFYYQPHRYISTQQISPTKPPFPLHNSSAKTYLTPKTRMHLLEHGKQGTYLSIRTARVTPNPCSRRVGTRYNALTYPIFVTSISNRGERKSHIQ